MASHIGWYNMYMDIYMEDLYPQCTDEKKVTKILLNLAGRNIEIYNKYNKTETKKTLQSFWNTLEVLIPKVNPPVHGQILFEIMQLPAESVS